MANIRQEIIAVVKAAVKDLTGQEFAIKLEHPVQESHGDYATNIAFVAAKYAKKSPMDLANDICQQLQQKISKDFKVSVAKPGFINFTLLEVELLSKVAAKKFEFSSSYKGKKIMVEYAHPNTHKEMHIGHMRTLITGEAICRLLEATGAKVFRANYQGDIGPHVAKALWGVQKIMEEKGLTLEKVEEWSSKDKAHFLGVGYVRGNQQYDTNKEEIDGLNSELYAGLSVIASDPPAGPPRLDEAGGERGNLEIASSGVHPPRNDNWNLYQITRQWSLDYYENFYQRFYTTFDSLFFENEMVEEGKRIVKDNLGKIFIEDNGAVIFPGEKYGLHNRVFITQAGNPTYEGKEMANAFAEHKAFPFDLKVHVVGSEQAGYFQVVFKALELIDPDKFKDKQHHISMGMVKLTDRKMSSRTGDILRVDWLIDQVKERIENLVKEGKIDAADKERVTEQVAIGAIKYSVLKVGTGQNVAFDIEKSVSLDGDSGPYLQYVFARTQSVLRKWQMDNKWKMENGKWKINEEELSLLRALYRFEEVVSEAAESLSPHILSVYLFDLAQKFNLFYQKHKILQQPVILGRSNATTPESLSLQPSPSGRGKGEGEEIQNFRLALTAAVGSTIKQGLNLLGIQAPEKM